MNYLARYFFTFCLLFFFKMSYSQKIILIDNIDKTPISDVTVYGKLSNKSLISNKKGLIDLKQFDKNDTLVFGHVSYYSIEIIKGAILEDSNLYLTPNTLELSEVILSVARNKESKEKISKQVSLITSKDLKLDLPQTSADLLTYASGIRVQKSQGGGGSPVIRGFEANRVLLVIDGVRMNNAIYRSGHLQNSITVNPNSLERTEIIYGPSSVGYGSDALGGVVHFYTKTPKINNNNKWNSNGISSYNVRLNNIIQNLDFEYSAKKWASYTNISFSKFGNIIMGGERKHGFDNWGLDNHYLDSDKFNDSEITNDNPKIQLNTAYEQYDFMQKFNLLLSESSNMIINLQHSNSSDINRFDKLNEIKNGNYKYSEWYYGPQKRTMISALFNFSKKKKLSDKNKLLLAYQKIGESRHSRRFQELSKINQTENLNVFSINNDYFKNYSNNSSLVYGFEYTYNNVNSKAFLQNYNISESGLAESDQVYNIPTRYPSEKGHYSTAAVYYEFRKDISKQSNFNIGMRFTNTMLKAKWNDDNIINANISDVNSKNSSLTSSLGYVFRSKNNWKISANFSSGFRSPNIDDIGKIRENNGILVVPNTFLKAEYAYNLDLGINYKSLNQLTYVSFRTFATVISRHIVRDDFIIFSDTTTSDESTILYNGEEVSTIANKNLGNRFIHGFSIDGFSYFSKSLKFNGSISYIKGDENETYGPMPSISPIFGTISGEYSKNKFKISALYKFSGDKSPMDYSLGGEDGLEETPEIIESNGLIKYAGTPKWSNFSIYTNYDISQDVKVRFALTNIFDNHYRSFASGISAPGRSFQIGLYLKL